MLMVLAAVASASVDPSPPAWIGTLQNPLIGGVIVAVLTQLLKAIPQVPIVKGPKVAAAAAILSVIVGAISAYSGGSFDGFDAGSAWNILITSIITLTTAYGTAEAAAHAGNALAPRSLDVSPAVPQDEAQPA